jgi:hypothetical protein
MTTISLDDLVALVRKASAEIESGSVQSLEASLAPLREHVKPGCHVGRGKEMDATDEGFRLQVEWYAGQLLSMVDNREFAGINSWLNCTDKFTRRMV